MDASILSKRNHESSEAAIATRSGSGSMGQRQCRVKDEESDAAEDGEMRQLPAQKDQGESGPDLWSAAMEG